MSAARGSDRSGNMAIPTTTKRALDVPSELKLNYRENITTSTSKADAKQELKRKLEATDQITQPTKKKQEEPLALEYEQEARFPEDEENSDDESAYSEDSDEEEALMRELARIKEERAAEEAKRLAEEAERERKIREQEIAVSNPLIGGGGSSSLRRRWDDDTVFQGQTRSAPKNERRFVNDAVRSEFHRKFINKYIV